MTDRTPSFFLEGILNSLIALGFCFVFWLGYPLLWYVGVSGPHGWGIALMGAGLMICMLSGRFERGLAWLEGMRFDLGWALCILYGCPVLFFLITAYLTLSWTDNDALIGSWIAALFVPALVGGALAWHVHAERANRLERLRGRP